MLEQDAHTLVPESGPPEVWVASGDGSDPRFLAGGYEPVWSPDGSMIIARRDGDRNGWTDLYVVLLPGGQVEQATFRGWTGDAFWLEAGRLAVHDPAQFAYWTIRWEPYEGFKTDADEPLLVDVAGEAHLADDRIFYAAANEASPQYGAPRVAVASRLRLAESVLGSAGTRCRMGDRTGRIIRGGADTPRHQSDLGGRRRRLRNTHQQQLPQLLRGRMVPSKVAGNSAMGGRPF